MSQDRWLAVDLRLGVLPWTVEAWRSARVPLSAEDAYRIVETIERDLNHSSAADRESGVSRSQPGGRG